MTKLYIWERHYFMAWALTDGGLERARTLALQDLRSSPIPGSSGSIVLHIMSDPPDEMYTPDAAGCTETG